MPFYSDVDGPARKVELKIVPQKSIPELPKKHIFSSVPYCLFDV